MLDTPTVIAIVSLVASFVAALLAVAAGGWFTLYSADRARRAEAERTFAKLRDPLNVSARILLSGIRNLLRSERALNAAKADLAFRDQLQLEFGWSIGRYLAWTYILFDAPNPMGFSKEQRDTEIYALAISRILCPDRVSIFEPGLEGVPSAFTLNRATQKAIGIAMSRRSHDSNLTHLEPWAYAQACKEDDSSVSVALRPINLGIACLISNAERFDRPMKCPQLEILAVYLCLLIRVLEKNAAPLIDEEREARIFDSVRDPGLATGIWTPGGALAEARGTHDIRSSLRRIAGDMFRNDTSVNTTIESAPAQACQSARLPPPSWVSGQPMATTPHPAIGQGVYADRPTGTASSYQIVPATGTAYQHPSENSQASSFIPPLISGAKPFDADNGASIPRQPHPSAIGATVNVSLSQRSDVAALRTVYSPIYPTSSGISQNNVVL